MPAFVTPQFSIGDEPENPRRPQSTGLTSNTDVLFPWQSSPNCGILFLV